MRAMDWSATPLGPVDAWPQSLRSTLSMLLPSKAQIILFWGPEFVVFYNDAYRPVFGAKHPHALGLSGRQAWSEIWDSILHELLAGVVRTGHAADEVADSRPGGSGDLQCPPAGGERGALVAHGAPGHARRSRRTSVRPPGCRPRRRSARTPRPGRGKAADPGNVEWHAPGYAERGSTARSH